MSFQSHSRSFLPADAPSSVAASAAAELFGESRSNNFNFIVLERDQPLNEQDRRFYDELIPTLRADAKHVNTVTDLWSDPATAAAGQSADRRAVTVMLRLAGMIGTSQATDSVAALRDALARLGLPQGLRVYVTDEIETDDGLRGAPTRFFIRLMFARRHRRWRALATILA